MLEYENYHFSKRISMAKKSNAHNELIILFPHYYRVFSFAAQNVVQEPKASSPSTCQKCSLLGSNMNTLIRTWIPTRSLGNSDEHWSLTSTQQQQYTKRNK